MSRYRITIVELTPNPKYDPQRASQGYLQAGEQRETESQSLTFTADEQQFAAIRKAALEAM